MKVGVGVPLTAITPAHRVSADATKEAWLLKIPALLVAAQIKDAALDEPTEPVEPPIDASIRPLPGRTFLTPCELATIEP